jgi:hypothetical protein
VRLARATKRQLALLHRPQAEVGHLPGSMPAAEAKQASLTCTQSAVGRQQTMWEN